MAAVSGQDFLLKVESTPGSGSFIIVANFNSYSKKSTSPETKYPVFANPTPLVSPGIKEQTFTVGGLFDPVDPGQAVLRAAESAQTPVLIEALFDGTNGFKQTVLVGGFTQEAKPDALQTISYDMSALDVAVTIGTGPIN
jgi:hypothetical protein